MAIRAAESGDVPALRDLAASAFGGGAAAVSESVEDGVLSGEIHVACGFDGRIAGYLQVRHHDGRQVSHRDDRVTRVPGSFIAELVVPPLQAESDVTAALVAHLSSMSVRRASVSLLVDPAAPAALRLLLAQDFVVTAAIADIFGPGEDRLLLRRDAAAMFHSSTDRSLVPPTTHHLASWLESGYVAVALVRHPRGDLLDLRKRTDLDEGQALSEEASSSVAFAGALLAVVTFVLSIGLSTNAFPRDLLLQLTAAFVAGLVALVAYANASGELARVRRGTMLRHVEVGNFVSEYFGVLLLIQVIPIALASTTGATLLGWAACALASVSLALYERSGLSIWQRIRISRWVRLSAQAAVIVGPVAGLALLRLTGTTTGWTFVNISVLGFMTACSLIRGEGDW